MLTLDRLRGDDGVSSILGFIVGLALLTGSMAAVVYFMTTASERGTSDATRDLQSAGVRTIETLTGSPGAPTNWHETSDLWANPPDQIGLLNESTRIASLDKIARFQNGDVNATILLKSYNLQASGMRMDAKASVVPVPVMRPPDSRTYAVANGSLVGSPEDTNDITLTKDSMKGLRLFEDVNTGYSATNHTWVWREGLHPETGLGNTFRDTPWAIETQLVPKMAKVAATYAADDREPSTDLGEAAVRLAQAYNAGSNEITRFHVITNGEPYTAKGSSGVSVGSHTLTINYHRSSGGGGGGWGPWRTMDGMDTWALLGELDTTGVSSATMTFDQVLMLNNDVTTECWEADGADCVNATADIMFWNTTADAWTPIQENPKDCGASGWNRNEDNESTGGSWVQGKTVDLCEAIEHSSGKLWLGLSWQVDCYENEATPAECRDVFDGIKNSRRSWFIDNVNVTSGAGKTLYSNTFSPMDKDRREVLFTSHGVNMDAYEATNDHIEANQYSMFQTFVKRGGNALAFQPGNAGDWLGELGLQAVSRNTTRHVTTDEPDQLIMRMPYELPVEDEAYDAAPFAWSTSATPATPNSSTPAGFNAPTVVQRTTETNPVATMLVGTPYDGGGKVTGIGYDLANFNSTSLRDKILENIYTSAVFKDPTFDTQGVDVPDRGTVPLHAATRVVLAETTDSGDYQVPIKVTMYIWSEQVG